jgi:hypothetical protein
LESASAPNAWPPPRYGEIAAAPVAVAAAVKKRRRLMLDVVRALQIPFPCLFIDFLLAV